MGKRTLTEGLPAGGGGGGERLPAGLLAEMSAAFGADLSAVRVHRDSPLAEATGASAVARGLEIHFAPGAYDPESLPGREVIGHELAHVIQQAQGRATAPVQTFGGVIDVDPGLEGEADDQGKRAARGERVMEAGSIGAPAAPVIQCLPHEQLRAGRYYLVQRAAAQVTAKLTHSERGNYQMIVVGTSAAITVTSEDDLLSEVQLHAAPKDKPTSGGGSSGGAKPAAAAAAAQGGLGGGPTACVFAGAHGLEALVSDELITCYLQDLRDDYDHHLQEGEGQAIAAALGVSATVMSQLSGPLIQATGITYGAAGVQGRLLHIGGNHYIVIAPSNAPNADYVDTRGQRYVELQETVDDGNCLIDGLFIIRHGRSATPRDIEDAREHAAKAVGKHPDNVRELLSAIIVGILQTGVLPGIGALTSNYILRDPNVQALIEGGSAKGSPPKDQEPKPASGQSQSKSDKSDASAKAGKSDKSAEPNAKRGKTDASEARGPSLSAAAAVAASGGSAGASPSRIAASPHALEDAVTTYLGDANRLGEAAAKKTAGYRLVLELWHQRYSAPPPAALHLRGWIADQETLAGDYYGSDTELDEDSEAEVDERAPARRWTAADVTLLAALNTAIRGAATHADIERILENRDYDRFVVPQFRGIAYMTNRFSRDKRREHRKASQLGKPVYADAVRPEAMSREDFYTAEHDEQSEVEQRKRDIEDSLVGMRASKPLVDPNRKVAAPKVGKGRIFSDRFRALQSDYSQDFSGSAAKIAKHHARANTASSNSGGSSAAAAAATATPAATASTASAGSATAPARPDPSFEDQVYDRIPFRSHPLVSTADQPRHAVRYALGNKPIAAEKPFRLRPRWRRTGKPQHPYSGKVYTSLHPLSDYLSPRAPSSVWMGRAQGALSIDNDISKEGESSFLGGIPRNRVVGQQVIRWPSLEASHDQRGGHGVSAETRAEHRATLAAHPPHSEEQRGMKSGALGAAVEEFYARKVAADAARLAATRDQLLVHRALDGTFTADEPVYKTPAPSTLKKWAKPATDATTATRLASVGTKQLPRGHATEGYFGDWPSREVYDKLEQSRRKPSAAGEDSYEPAARGAPSPDVQSFVGEARGTVAETARALGALMRQRDLARSWRIALAAGSALVLRAFSRMYDAARRGWSAAELRGRLEFTQTGQLLGSEPRTGADPVGWLEGVFEAAIASLERERAVLAGSWGAGAAEDPFGAEMGDDDDGDDGDEGDDERDDGSSASSSRGATGGGGSGGSGSMGSSGGAPATGGSGPPQAREPSFEELLALHTQQQQQAMLQAQLRAQQQALLQSQHQQAQLRAMHAQQQQQQQQAQLPRLALPLAPAVALPRLQLGQPNAQPLQPPPPPPQAMHAQQPRPATQMSDTTDPVMEEVD